jgi:peptidyl-prolyl cis-trans isomerase B (cyclophilin B)
VIKYVYQIKGMESKMAKNNKTNTAVSKKQAEREARLKRAKRKRLIKIAVLLGILLAIVAITLIVVFSVKSCNDKKENPPKQITYATMTFGDYGSVTIKLDDENAPQTVKQFKKLASAGKYTGLELVKSENGCLYSDYEQNWATIFGEFKRNGVQNNLSHKKGVISMIRDNDYNSGNGTFFFTTEDKVDFDGSYCAFGEIISGMDVIEKMASGVSKNDGSDPYPSVTKITFETKTENAK